LVSRNGYHGEDIVLFDPSTFKKESNSEYLINYINPSYDGSMVAISLTKNDEEISEMVILNVATKELYPEIITNCWPSEFDGVCWLKDNYGFIYTHIPVIDKNSEEYILNTEAVLYKLGTNPKNLQLLLSKKHNPAIKIQSEDFPIVNYKYNYGNYIFGGIFGVSPFADYYYSEYNENTTDLIWNPLFKKEDKISKFIFDGSNIYFLTAKNASNFKLCKTSIIKPDFNNAEIIISEDSNSVLSDFVLTKDGIYYVTTKNGVESQLFKLKNNTPELFEIPKKLGSIEISSKGVNSQELWIEIEGWTNNKERYSYQFDKNKFIHSPLTETNDNFSLNDIIVEELEITSHDGTKVPLSIIYDKKLKKDNSNPVLINAYGAYGISIAPGLGNYLYQWVSAGGIYAVAHVRGGGEKGDSWHKGGYKSTKPNSWKDLIACTEYLISENYTRPENIAITSGSAGGMVIGCAITERPDLFAAAIIRVGVINTTRQEFGPNGQNNIKEFGSVKDSLEFLALLEMDAYQHLKKGTKYPAVLLCAGMNDARVPAWHSSKFAAKLQEFTSSEKPVLLSVDFKGGHGQNASNISLDNTILNVLSFALWQTGHPDYQALD
jgi:prolyl oligopeptidase